MNTSSSLATTLAAMALLGCGIDSSENSSSSNETTSAATSSGDSSGTSTGSGPGTGSGSSTGSVLACNGHQALCDRPYDQVAFPTTHNSMAAQDAGFTFNANHKRVLARQLEDGVRGLLLDVTYDGEETALCHGPCSLGSIPHVEALSELATFLGEHPQEVVTILYEDSISAADLEADFQATGLADRVYTHTEGQPWPTLAGMIAANTRLVITAQTLGPPPGWLHHLWDVCWDTPYSFMSPEEFSCELNRGDVSNDLFLLNHWVNNELDLPSEENAATVNTFEVLHSRATQCQEESGQIPNFIAVDFYEQGDLFAVVDALNGL